MNADESYICLTQLKKLSVEIELKWKVKKCAEPITGVYYLSQLKYSLGGNAISDKVYDKLAKIVVKQT